MRYRIMKIGDKYAAQIVDADGCGHEYISHDGTGDWTVPKSIKTRCLHKTIDEARKTGDKYISQDSFDQLLSEAVEVKS